MQPKRAPSRSVKIQHGCLICFGQQQPSSLSYLISTGCKFQNLRPEHITIKEKGYNFACLSEWIWHVKCFSDQAAKPYLCFWKVKYFSDQAAERREWFWVTAQDSQSGNNRTSWISPFFYCYVGEFGAWSIFLIRMLSVIWWCEKGYSTQSTRDTMKCNVNVDEWYYFQWWERRMISWSRNTTSSWVQRECQTLVNYSTLPWMCWVSIVRILLFSQIVPWY